KREAEGKGPALSAPSINEPRFVSESYFMDFKFEPGNYYLAGKETLEGKELLKVDYLPTKMFDDEPSEMDKEESAAHKAEERKTEDERRKDEDKKKDDDKKKDSKKDQQKADKEKKQDEEIDRKFDKTSQVTLWVDPQTQQIVKYTFDNVWLDFLPAGWLVKIDDLRASMQMGQPFPGVWLPHNMNIHAGLSFALGPLEMQYRREFSNYRKAEVTSKIRVPK